MNSTSFTSIDRSSGDSGAAQAGLSMQLDASDKMDSSSTAPLTLAETPVVMVAGAGGRPVRFSHPSDSEEPDASPSVTVLTLSSSSAASNGPNCSQHQQLQPHRHHSSNGNTNSSNNKNNNSSHRQMNQSNSLHLKHHPHHHSSNHHHLHAHQQHPSLTRPTQLLSSGFSLSNRLTKHQRTLWSRANSFEKLLMFIVLLLATLAIVLLIALVSVFMAHRRHFELEHGSNQSASAGAGLAAAASSTRFNAQQEVTYGERAHMTPASSHPLFSNKSFCLTPDCVKVAASVIEAIDLTIDPCDDFYLYSCGDWIKSNPLPDGKSNWGTFSKLWQDNQSIMRAVLEGVNFKPGSAEEKAKVYYESCLDRNDTVELRGTKPMQDLIESAGGWSISGAFNVKEWDLQSSLQIYHNQYNRGGLFSWAVGADERNSTRNIIQLDQGGLGLPSRDYYLNKTDKNVLDSYLIYMIKVAELMGGTNVEEQMKDVLEFEKKLAGITVPQDQRRDDERMYHKLTLRELSNRSSFINWTKYFDDAFDYHSRTTISFSSEIRPRNTGANGSASSATTSDAHTHNHQQHHNNNNNNNHHHHHHHHEQDEPKNRSASRADNGKQAAVPASSRPAPVLDEADDDDDFEDEAPTALSAKAAAAIAAIAREPTSTPSPAELATASATARASATLAAQSSPMGSGSPPVSTIKKHKITEEENIVIYSPEYFDDLSTLINQYAKTDRGKITLANYMAWSVIQSLIATLPKNFRDASKALRKALIGSEGIEVSWRYCVTDTNQVMGFALGSLFVRRVFQGKSKERAEEMIYSIRDAFKDNLSNLNWMDDRTRMLAREKADHINQMIGFPDFILNPEKLNGKYEGLELDENNYFENNIKVNVLSLRENMEKINMPANKTEWEMTPPMVNAYYTPTKNQIVFPAGILQTPFYDLSYPNSLNYGAMGVVMGHELTHAFDDQGREYDKDGNLYQWWYNETLKNFEDRVKCFVDQYSSYKVDESNLNGKQTLGENIADNGGLKAAFRAFEKWSEQHPEPNLPGLNLTSKQLFFVGFAQVWCSVSTPEALKLQVLNDPHAPAQFRVIGTLSNSQEFAREFNCPVGSKMNPEKKCLVW